LSAQNISLVDNKTELGREWTSLCWHKLLWGWTSVFISFCKDFFLIF